MNRTLPDRQSGGPRPQNFVHDPQCAHNQQAQLIPDDACVEWEQVPMAPSTVKHLYGPEPEGYDQRFQTRPKDTLYDQQFTETWPSGLGKKKVLGGGHYKVYPLTNRHVIESREYTSHAFPRPQWGTERQRGLVTHPNHVRPDGWK